MESSGLRYQAGAVDLGALKQQKAATEASESGAAFQPLITVTQDNLENEVLRMSTRIPVVVHIGTDRSPDSQELSATFARLAEDQKRFRVAYVDADATPVVAQMFGVRVLPTVLALAAGRPVTSFEGNQPAEQLSQWLDALVSNVGSQLAGLGEQEGADEAQEPSDPRLDAAAAAIERGEFAEATGIYDSILAEQPDNAEVKQARAMVTVLERLDSAHRDTDPIAAADADEADVDKQLDAADAEVVAGAAERAFDRLLRLVTTEPRAKARLLELFTLFEPGDARVIEARTKLASALF